MKSLLFEFEGEMHINQPINEDHTHVLVDVGH